MSEQTRPAGRWSLGKVAANAAVSRGLIRLDVRLDQSAGFLPGQFAMLNLAGPDAFIFGRPFSILAVDGDVMSFLYRVVGRGTEAMVGLAPGAGMTVFGPLGTPFPPSGGAPNMLLAGGVGLPPLLAWWDRFAGSRDRAFFGGRDGGDAPWDLLPAGWEVSVDRDRDLPAGRIAFTGLVTELAQSRLAAAAGAHRILACGPLPLLAAAARWAAEMDWECFVSLEEHMGCGYGVCKGCVVPVLDDAGSTGWRNATCCQEGPVFEAGAIDWTRWLAATSGE